MTSYSTYRWCNLLRGASALTLGFGLFCSASAVAQTQDSPDKADETREPAGDIVVTGSRIDRAGFEAPTPTTVLGEADLRQGSRSNVAALLNDQPQFRATNTPVSTAGNTNNSAATADLRGLGAVRTLTLVNGRRFTGSADLNNLPMSLVKRIDVVTGGASAAWGSGAVAGVVNIILDDNLEGLTLGGTTGISSRGDGARYGLDASFGTNFADGRGHFMVAAEYLNDKGVLDRNSRKNLGSAALYNNPNYAPGNGQHLLILARDVNMSDASPGGLITSGVLAGQTFNSDGSLRAFRYGNPRNSTAMIGGEGTGTFDYLSISSPAERINSYARATFDVGDATLWADASYGRISGHFDFFPETNRGNLTISRDNPFLSATIRNQLLSAGQTSFLLGRTFADYGILDYKSVRENYDGAIGIDGTLSGGNWRYSAFYGHSELRSKESVGNLKIAANFANAIDVVTGPSGQPICRIALTVPGTDCRPLNLFGAGAASQESVAYSFGQASQTSAVKLDTAGVSLRGDLFSLWAGPVSVAIGAEARWEHTNTVVDARSSARAFSTLNFGALNGGFNVKEGFAEIAVPLLDVEGINKLEINAAARYSDYSNSGGIWSWKIGATDRIFDDLLLRITRSRDIRSGSLNELFTTRTTNIGPIADPVTGATYEAFRYGGGNPNLAPEVASTLTLGATYSPSFASGLNLSVDYYRISISDVITSLSAQSIVDRCFAGNASLCDQIVRDPAVGNRVTQVFATFVNLAKYKTSGIDFEASYRLPLDKISSALPGSLRVRALATYVDTQTTDDGVTKIELVGDVGDRAGGTPKWKGTGSITYEGKDVSVDLRVRYVDGGLFNHLLDVENNKIESRTYVDLGGRFNIGNFTLFGTVNNLFDRKPPITTYGNIHYDVIGTYFQMGAKVRF